MKLTSFAAIIGLGLTISTACQNAPGNTPPLSNASIDGGPAPAAARPRPTPSASDSSRSGTSVLLGVRVIDYLLLALGSDTAARIAAVNVSAALRSLPGGSVVAARFDSLSARGSTMPPPEIYEAIEQVVDVPRFRAAGWAEFARVFAADHFEPGMRWTQLRGALDEMSRDPALTPEEQWRSDALLASIATGPRDWSAIERASMELLAALRRSGPTER